MSEISDALRQQMLPCLGLRSVMRLAGTCREWHQLVSETPLHHLSKEARLTLLPPGLTSNLPLLGIVKQQSQLLAGLRGKHGFTPDIQRLSFADDLLKSSQEGDAAHSGYVPPLRFQSVLWSPCDSLEDASRWLALFPAGVCRRLPIVLDTKTGQQVCFEEGSSPMRLTPGNRPDLPAAWLMDKPGQIWFFMASGKISGSVACLADVHPQSLLPIGPPGHQFSGTSQFFTVCSEEGSALDVLCWFPEHAPGFDNQIIVFIAFSRQMLYQLSCPQQLCRHFMHFQDDESSSAQQTNDRQDIEAVLSCQVLLAPNKQLFAVVWDWQESSCLGLSIHSASRGDLLHSMLLMEGIDANTCICQPRWLPSSSNFMYANGSGLLHLITPSGSRLWSSAWADRHPGHSTAPARHDIATTLNASPCGRWILVMESAPSDECPETSTRHVTVVEASTGRNLARFDTNSSLYYLEVRWSMPGEVCFIASLDWVLVCYPQADPTLTTIRPYQLLDTESSGPFTTLTYPSLSPCGSTVIDLDSSRDPGLRHWQIPPTEVDSLTVTNKSASALKTLIKQPVVCADLMAGQLGNGILHEAWHPWHSACIYAVSSSKGGVHLIDTRANRCVQSWTEDELHGPAEPTAGSEGVQCPELHDADDNSAADDSDDESDESDLDVVGDHYVFPHALSWSKDGCRLAVASKASVRRGHGARCSVLCF